MPDRAGDRSRSLHFVAHSGLGLLVGLGRMRVGAEDTRERPGVGTGSWQLCGVAGALDQAKLRRDPSATLQPLSWPSLVESPCHLTGPPHEHSPGLGVCHGDDSTWFTGDGWIVASYKRSSASEILKTSQGRFSKHRRGATLLPFRATTPATLAPAPSRTQRPLQPGKHLALAPLDCPPPASTAAPLQPPRLHLESAPGVMSKIARRRRDTGHPGPRPA